MIQKVYRSLVTAILVAVCVFLVACGSPAVKTPPTYSASQLEQIHRYQGYLQQVRDRFPELQKLIASKNWVDTRTFIHGPLGEIRRQSSYVTRLLLPEDQKQIEPVAKQLYESLEQLDKAAAEDKSILAQASYKEAEQAFSRFLELIP